jgi:hypothetical protein
LKNVNQKVGQGQITSKRKKANVILSLRENEKPQVITDHSSRHLVYLKHSFGLAVKKRKDVNVIEEKRAHHEPYLKQLRERERSKETCEEFSDFLQTLFYKILQSNLFSCGYECM